MAKKNKNNMQRRRKTDRPPKLIDAVEAYITHNQEILAALAWAGYQQEGRGFVLVAIEENGGLDASYVGEQDDLWGILQPDFPELAELIQEYDPSTQVALVRRVPDYTEMGIATWEVPPPVAYARHERDLF